MATRVYKDVDLAALLRLDHYLHEGIVLAKQLEYLAQSGEVRKRIEEIRRQLEVLAAKLTNEVTAKI
jgi:hypothetical protein